jgi:hypothetical protein
MSLPTATPIPDERGPRAWWTRLQPRQRRRLRVLLAAIAIFVLLVAVLLARFLQVENVERQADLALIQAEARGDAAAMIAQLSGCRQSPACVQSVKRELRNPRLHRAGAVKILSLTAATANSPTATTGKTRVAWTVIGTLPVVQCIDVRRTGNFLTGMHVHLIGIGNPIPNEALCRKRTQKEVEEAELTKLEQ